MTTPRIEELVKELRMVANMINLGEKIRWGQETALMDEAADTLQALTQIRQETLDEAVEVLEKAKNKANKEATREYGEGVYEGLCHAVHLVKALQDNK